LTILLRSRLGDDNFCEPEVDLRTGWEKYWEKVMKANCGRVGVILVNDHEERLVECINVTSRYCCMKILLILQYDFQSPNQAILVKMLIACCQPVANYQAVFAIVRVKN